MDAIILNTAEIIAMPIINMLSPTFAIIVKSNA